MKDVGAIIFAISVLAACIGITFVYYVLESKYPGIIIEWSQE